jgi:hypothetical protein
MGAQGVLIIAESGSGKSTSIESLNPKETFIINVANKPLPFKGWKKKYTLWSKDNPTGNMYDKSNPESIEACLKYINEKRPEIKTIVVDDWQYMSSFEFFDKAQEKGYEKFTSIGAHLARIARMPKEMRDDLIIYFLTHAEEATDMEGKRKFKAKIIGKMIDEKLTLEGLFSIVLFAKAKKNKEGEMRYVFETQTTGDNTCKSPREMFANFEIPNDLQFVSDCIKDYEN